MYLQLTKRTPTDESNFHPVSVLSLIFKIFEKLLMIMDRSKNKLLTCFRKAYATQHVQFCLLQRWQQELDNSGMIGTFSMDLYKAYDWLLIDLIVREFEAYDFYKTQNWSQLAL